MMPVVGPIGLSTAAFGPNCTDCGMGGFTVGSTRARSINHSSRLKFEVVTIHQSIDVPHFQRQSMRAD